MKDDAGADLPGKNNVVSFPITAEQANAMRATAEAYWNEMYRVDRLLCAGKRARFNRRIRDAYYDLRDDSPWRDELMSYERQGDQPA